MMNNRATRRRKDREHEEYVKEIQKLTPKQSKLIEMLSDKKAGEMITVMSKIINKCYYKALRNNKVGEVRANKIIDDTEKLIDLESREEGDIKHEVVSDKGPLRKTS